MGKINQMRNTPAGSGRSVSPHKPSPKSKPKPKDFGTTNSSTLPRDKKLAPLKVCSITLAQAEFCIQFSIICFP